MFHWRHTNTSERKPFATDNLDENRNRHEEWERERASERHCKTKFVWNKDFCLMLFLFIHYGTFLIDSLVFRLGFCANASQKPPSFWKWLRGSYFQTNAFFSSFLISAKNIVFQYLILDSLIRSETFLMLQQVHWFGFLSVPRIWWNRASSKNEEQKLKKESTWIFS